MNLSLYQRVSELHGTLPWGSVLDAGTGPVVVVARDPMLDRRDRLASYGGYRS